MKEIAVAIVGAGAAGLMLASPLRCQQKPFVLFESQKQVGQKILISGGGRCNILPSRMSLDDFESYSSKKLLQRILFFHPLEYWKRFFEGEL
ncbi:MAG: NAD(P)/FAD-dependent oxidoreductase, partial [Planctomycetota bacterium]